MVIRTMHRLLRCHKRVVFYNIFPDVCVCVGGGGGGWWGGGVGGGGGGGGIKHCIIYTFAHLHIWLILYQF